MYSAGVLYSAVKFLFYKPVLTLHFCSVVYSTPLYCINCTLCSVVYCTPLYNIQGLNLIFCTQYSVRLCTLCVAAVHGNLYCVLYSVYPPREGGVTPGQDWISI